jgi:hypothetical protein
MTLDTGAQFSMGHGELRVNRVSALSLTDLTLSTRDREVLRGVAGHVAELAARPIEDDKRSLWYRHNALEPTRPVIFCDPEDGWLEIIPLCSLLAMPTLHEEPIRADLRKALQMTRCCRVEVIVKDNHKVNDDPQRLTRRVQVAREEAERV